MTDKIVFFNTGWMDFYKGISNDTITGGGKHVDKEGWGGEIYNFKNYEGLVYGYVQPKIDKKYGNPSTIKIDKLGATETAEKISGVTVIWTARHPYNGGTYIVGWYLNATVFRYERMPPKNAKRKFEDIELSYYATTGTEDAKLLSIDERVIHIRRQEKNWMGQSNVWYAENNPEFVKLVTDYVFLGEITDKLTKRTKQSEALPRQTDPLKRIEVEKNAIKVVVSHYEKLGYQVNSVEKDNVGWDLTANKEETEIKLEVKGLSGNIISTELTPNEFKNSQADKRFYRLCLVTEALSKKPKLKIFAYSRETKAWTSEDGSILKFEMIISARIYE